MNLYRTRKLTFTELTGSGIHDKNHILNCSLQSHFMKNLRDKICQFFSQKKYLCDFCVLYKTGNISEEVHEAHIKRKNEASAEKIKDKEMEECIFTMDLKSVFFEVRAQGYSRCIIKPNS